MDRNHKHRSWNEKHNKNRDNRNNQKPWPETKNGKTNIFRPQIKVETAEEIAEKEAAIRELKSKSLVCPICSKPITEAASSMTDKNTGNPAHFDCVLAKIAETEKPGPNEKITYIGGGKFAVLYFENPHDMKHFQIRRTIEWENQDTDRTWRNEYSGLFSQIK